MSPKQTRQESEEQQSGRNTRARARRLNHTSEMDVTLTIGEEKRSHTKRKKRIALVGKDTVSNESLSKNERRSEQCVDGGSARGTRYSRVSPSYGRTDVLPIDNDGQKKLVEGEASPRKAALNVTRTPEKQVRVSRTVSDATTGSQSLTPKSSPIPVSLTPHRSAKTPKKSPKNLASPKTHSVAPLRLSKTPRKLPLTSDSPKMSPRSGSAMKTKKKLGEAKRESTSRLQFVSKTPNKTSSVGLKHGIRRFSKSPKIVLRSPKPKSRKSKSPKIKVTPSNGKVTPRRSKGSPEGKGSFSAQKPTILARKTSPAVPETTSSKTPKRSVPSTELMSDYRNPVVVLQRLSPQSNVASTSDRKKPVRKTTGKIRVAEGIASPTVPFVVLHANDTCSSVALKSPPSTRKIASPRKSKTAENEVHAPSTRSRELTSPSVSSSADRARDKSSALPKPTAVTPLVDTNHSVKKPLMSSTPHDKKTRRSSLRDSTFEGTSSATGKRSNRARSVDTSKSPTREATMRNATIENESEPSLCELDLPDSGRNNTLGIAKMNGDGTKVKDSDDDDDKDRTYELLEPKTPNLREKCRKRSFAEADLSEKEEKRRCKVRFASPMAKTKETNDESYSKNTPSTNKAISGNSEKRSITSKSKALFRGAKSPIGRSKRTNSSINGGKSPFLSSMSSRVERLSKSFSEINSTVSPSFTFSVKKPDPKFSGTKKIPNFAELHKKMFAKSESLIDAKKRLEERHTALTAKKATPSVKIEASSARDRLVGVSAAENAGYNRFGFRLRKNEATDSIMNKCHLNSSRKKKQQQQKQESRAMIKGVRTNRRFELQMKSRNMNA